jgi:hypothetical protein
VELTASKREAAVAEAGGRRWSCAVAPVNWMRSEGDSGFVRGRGVVGHRGEGGTRRGGGVGDGVVAMPLLLCSGNRDERAR